jgi:MFS family permease
LVPKGYIGQYTGMFSMMRGLANIIAPMIAGAAVDLVARYLQGGRYQGREYGVIWVVAALMIVISLFLFRGSDKDDLAGRRRQNAEVASAEAEGLQAVDV